MISQLKPKNVDVLSLTTIATPHRGGFGFKMCQVQVLTLWQGSAFADYIFEQIGGMEK